MSGPETGDKPAANGVAIVRRDHLALSDLCAAALSRHLDGSPRRDREVARVPDGAGAALGSRSRGPRAQDGSLRSQKEVQRSRGSAHS